MKQGKGETTKRPADQAREEMAFEFGDFNAHQPVQIMEERKQQKKRCKRKSRE
ncbi:hypothetical protein PTHTG4_26490 [Parageobacillus thermoglucosidasius]|uniref:hypothetical protein n=1 Tax=Parageobacillus thermoglucosidasius TaxID=1426 RepID=UPI000FFA585D|nr:hypothetical protein [Parageobacillus thermoglucosidasius]GCD83586.1 hypothetical protein PTHTG4_26490 [Parageobacillus thermoglucosidasius]